MASNARFAEVVSLAGEPARAGMLHALMDGRALTASELARVAGITAQTASGHDSQTLFSIHPLLGWLSCQFVYRYRYIHGYRPSHFRLKRILQMPLT